MKELHNQIKNVKLNDLKHYLKDYLDIETVFTVCSDGDLTYELETEYSDIGFLTGYEITISTNSILFYQESLRSLLNKKQITFLGIRQYKEGNAISKYIISKD